ncbi:MAG TPA: hypothetical protein VJR90_03380 [Gammaproteobacteria bacterium]|nr:hypothetical protein [Gammaproteobacteria bacterium]
MKTFILCLSLIACSVSVAGAAIPSHNWVLIHMSMADMNAPTVYLDTNSVKREAGGVMALLLFSDSSSGSNEYAMYEVNCKTGKSAIMFGDIDPDTGEFTGIMPPAPGNGSATPLAQAVSSYLCKKIYKRKK